ncbi:MAG: S1 RNA-binding domain-containing protein, partial [Calditerrivibrio sp.]|nr:S1 RNA-binding domain-containing protein [Calditerrivibrio sp.]
ISSVTSFGMFVELDNSIEGLVHVTNMLGDYYNYDEKTLTLTGERTRKIYRIGQRVEIEVLSVNPNERQIDFVIVSDNPKEESAE